MPNPGYISEAYQKPHPYTGGAAVYRHTEPVSTQKVDKTLPRERRRGGVVRPIAKAEDHGNEEVVEKEPMKPHTYAGRGSKMEKMAHENTSEKNPYAMKLTPHEKKRGGKVEGAARRRHDNRPGHKGVAT